MTRQKLSVDELSVTAIRMLAIDTVNKAKSGHPGEFGDSTGYCQGFLALISKSIC